MKYAVIADIHFGNSTHGKDIDGTNSRWWDTFEALEFVSAKLQELDYKLLIVAGDVFDRPSPSPRVRALFNRWVRELGAAGINLWLILGQHDCSVKYHSLEPVAKLNLSHVQVIDSPTVHDEEDVRFLFLPWGLRVGKAAPDWDAALLALADKRRADAINVLICHFLVSGCELPAGSAFSGVSMSKLELFDLVFAGDNHRGQQKGNVYVPGSVIPQTFAEAKTPHLMYLVDGEQVTSVDIPSRPLREITLRVETPHVDDLIPQVTDNVKPGEIVRIMLAGVRKKVKALPTHKLRTAAREAGAFHVLPIVYAIEQQSTGRISDPETLRHFRPGKAPADLIRAWVEKFVPKAHRDSVLEESLKLLDMLEE